MREQHLDQVTTVARTAGAVQETAELDAVPDGADPKLGAPDRPQLAHELRTPLNAILGNVELLLDGSAGPLGAKARACLGDVQLAGRQLLAQVEPVLLLLELATGRARPAKATVDVVEILSRTLARSSGEPIAWELAPPEARLLVEGDPFWLDALAQALRELAGAGMAAPDRRVRAALDFSADPAGTVQLWLGWSGFDPDHLPLIWLLLIDAILLRNGGRAWVVAARGLCLHWSAARVVFR